MNERMNQLTLSSEITGDDRLMNDTTMPLPAKGSTAKEASADGLRKKVGRFGLADWTRLLSSAKDLAQRKGQPLRKIRWDEIKQHKSIHDGWIVLKGKVYNVSSYIAYHPGGETMLRIVLGRDATQLYEKYHSWVNEEG